MGHHPAKNDFQDPVDCLGEQIEDPRGRTQSEGKKELDVELAFPFEYEAPLIPKRDGDVAESRLEIAFDHTGATTHQSNHADGHRQSFVLDLAVLGGDAVIDRFSVGTRKIED